MFCCGKKPKPTHVAIFEYEATKLGEISFNKGDYIRELRIINDDWMEAINMTNNRERGQVPVNHVAKIGTLEAEDWFFKGFLRQDAVGNLLANQQIKGKFLIRSPESKMADHQFSISILDHSAQKGGFFVKHFRIKQNKEKRFYIGQDYNFPNLHELIQHYQEKKLITVPCEKTKPLVFQEWEIKRAEIHMEHKLGAGNFGEVCKGTWRKKSIAIKTLKEGSMDPQKFLEEADIMKRIRHKNLVALYGVCTDIEPYYIIQEFMTNGSLLECLRKKPRIFKFSDLLYISMQVASGMSYLENKLLIHRDLAARNVLVGEKCVAKICDFGLAKLIEEDIYETSANTALPIRWTAPEALDRHQYSIKSDVWSFGILLTEIFSFGQTPYHGMQNREVSQKIKYTNFRMAKPVNEQFVVPDVLYQQMMECWKKNPLSRPTFERLKVFFEDFSTESDAKYEDYNNISNTQNKTSKTHQGKTKVKRK